MCVRLVFCAFFPGVRIDVAILRPVVAFGRVTVCCVMCRHVNTVFCRVLSDNVTSAPGK